MKTAKFVAIDINEIMERVFARTNVVGDDDGNVILGRAGSGKTFRMLYEAVQCAWGGDKVLIAEDELDVRCVQERLSMVMDYLNISMDDRRKMDINIMEIESHRTGYDLLCDIKNNSNQYGAVFIDLVPTSQQKIETKLIDLLDGMGCDSFVCKQSNIEAHINGDL